MFTILNDRLLVLFTIQDPLFEAGDLYKLAKYTNNKSPFLQMLLQTLHAKYTIQLLLEVRRILKTQGNIRYASTSLSKQVTVCGDIHGKLSDLYTIFHKVPYILLNNKRILTDICLHY